MENKISIGDKIICMSPEEYIRITQDLVKQGFEFESKFIPRLFEKTWTIKIIGCKRK